MDGLGLADAVSGRKKRHGFRNLCRFFGDVSDHDAAVDKKSGYDSLDLTARGFKATTTLSGEMCGRVTRIRSGTGITLSKPAQ